MSRKMSEVRALWIFNYDGTICGPVSDRQRTRIEASCEAMLKKLVEIPFYKIAILSSRPLDDLIPRIEIPGICLGGENGNEWLLPEGIRTKMRDMEATLSFRRRYLLPQIKNLERYPGIKVEDRQWSVAARFQGASATTIREIKMILEELSVFRSFPKFTGSEEIEVSLLPEIDKAFGIRSICGFLNFEPKAGELIYAGDHENDVSAMEWVRFLKGIVFTVGSTPLLRGSKLASSPNALAVRIVRYANIHLKELGSDFVLTEPATLVEFSDSSSFREN